MIAAQIERERVAAKVTVERLKSAIRKAWNSSVPRAWRTAGMVLELADASTDLLRRDTTLARQLAQYAIVIANGIAADAYPSPIAATISATAWKTLANVHRYVSNYQLALRAITAAERCLANNPAVDFDRSVVRFARALILCDMERLDEADGLADQTMEAFVEYRDHRRYGHALLLKGMIAHRRRRFGHATEVFAQAIDAFSKTDDLPGLASAYNNLGYSQAEDGATGAAVSSLQNALSIFEALGLAGESARTRCILASVLIRNGQYERANNLLSAGRRIFRELHMVEEDGGQGLVQADVLLALGDVDAARAIITDVIDLFRRAALNERTIVALAYLSEMIATPRAREAVAHVRRYVSDLRDTPRAAFAPLPD